MPAGGTWKAQNKVRPGAYINFKAVQKPNIAVGTRGIVACALPMTWGPSGEVITLYSTELMSDKALAKIGCNVNNIDESLPYRLLLSDCYKALLFNLNTGGAKATATLQTDLTVSAKYAGSTGNKVSVAVIVETAAKYLHVFFDGILKEIFTVNTFGDCLNIDSQWIECTCETAKEPTELIANAGSPLTGGTNGSISTNNVTTFLDKIRNKEWNCCVVQSTDTSVPTTLTNSIKDLRENVGKKVQAVVYNTNAANYEGIISTKGQGYKTESETITPELFQLWVANITAGAAVNESNTSRQIIDAIEIINPVSDSDIEDALKNGYFIITSLFDGTVVVEQDINTLRTYNDEKSYVFSKNRVIRCLDEIANTALLVFNKQYCGAVSNTFDQRTSFKSQLISYIDTLQNMEAVQNFDASNDISVEQGDTIESVVVDVALQPVDSMEKLYMTVYVNA